MAARPSQSGLIKESPVTAVHINPLHHDFAAEIIGLDIRQQVTPEVHDLVEAAMDRYAVVAIRDQERATDADQVRFSRAFGPLELSPELGMSDPARRRRVAREVYDVSNLDDNGEMDGPDTLRRKFAKGNEFFHTDSSFNDLPTKWSLLLAHEVPAQGGNTEFVDTRVAYERLSPALRRKVAGLEVEHDLTQSRARGGLTGTDVFARAFPPVIQPLVRASASGRTALYIGSHAARVIGMDEAEGRALLDELVARATAPDRVYSHKWRVGDLVIWDNRCTMHRATPFEYMVDRRDLRRTTINEYGEERMGVRA